MVPIEKKLLQKSIVIGTLKWTEKHPIEYAQKVEQQIPLNVNKTT